jgi:hypothetical protein
MIVTIAMAVSPYLRLVTSWTCRDTVETSASAHVLRPKEPEPQSASLLGNFEPCQTGRLRAVNWTGTKGVGMALKRVAWQLSRVETDHLAPLAPQSGSLHNNYRFFSQAKQIPGYLRRMVYECLPEEYSQETVSWNVLEGLAGVYAYCITVYCKAQINSG